MVRYFIGAFIALVWGGLGSIGSGQELPTIDTLGELTARLDAQVAEIEALRRRLESHEALYGPASSGSNGECDKGPDMQRLPVVVEGCRQPSNCEPSEVLEAHTLKFYTDYDSGFAIRPFCPEKYPFELNASLWTQFRHHAFARDVASWTDNAGVSRPVRNRNAFDIERARLVLSGYVLDERLTYFIQLDADSDGGHVVDFFDHWWAWQVTEQFQLLMGKRKVPGGRQWLLGARRTRLVDRPMACDFFRPDRTVGLFGIGRIGESVHYELMVGNGYNTANLPNSQTDDRFTFAATNYFEPWGAFGGQIVDYANSSQALVQFGHSLVYSPNRGQAFGVPFDEADFVRLSDGTRLTQTGALAPGVTVSDFDVFFYSIDAAWKWRGWSANTEVYCRWIERIRGDGAVPRDDLFQHGFFVEGGRFVIPQKLDLNIRYSQVNGVFGNASEYAAGLSWYPVNTHKIRITFDVTELKASPLNNTTSDILVGDDGTLLRTQFQAEF